MVLSVMKAGEKVLRAEMEVPIEIDELSTLHDGTESEQDNPSKRPRSWNDELRPDLQTSTSSTADKEEEDEEKKNWSPIHWTHD